MRRCLNFRHVEVIRAVTLTGTVTGAANRLHVTQPAVSNIIRDAETRLGFALFERAGGRITPTKKAELLVAEIERAFTGLDVINEVCAHLTLHENRRIAIVSTPSFAAAVLPAVIRQYRERYPDVRFSLVSRSSDLVQSLVISQKADIGFGLEVPGIPGVRQDEVLNTPLYCVVGADHPLAARTQVCAADLRGHDMISFSHLNEGTLDTSSELFGQISAHPESVVDCASSITICALVEGGIGFALAHSMTLQMFRQSNLRAVPFVPATRLAMCAYRAEAHDTSALNLDYLIELARKHAHLLDEQVRQRFEGVPAAHDLAEA